MEKRAWKKLKKFLKWVGADNLEIIEKHGFKFGFLGFDFVDNEPSEANLGLIRESKKKVNILIVGVHWGVEYQPMASKKQMKMAKKLVENGADVIGGHHPHRVQNIEHISGKPVYYSLGNFIFDQMWSEETKRGLVIKLTFRDSELKTEEKLPIYMASWAQPGF